MLILVLAVTIAGLTITNSRNRTLIHISPNAFPAARYSAKRDIGDDSPIDYIQVRPCRKSPCERRLTEDVEQDPDSTLAGASPSFILRLSNEEELNFNFTCVLRQQTVTTGLPETGVAPKTTSVDTQVVGLTYIFASNARELDQLVTREFHADPNLHKNPNVQLVGDYSTSGVPSVQFDWTWRWKPPKLTEDRGGGWRNTCSVSVI